jgi:hypothetical protein
MRLAADLWRVRAAPKEAVRPVRPSFRVDASLNAAHHGIGVATARLGGFVLEAVRLVDDEHLEIHLLERAHLLPDRLVPSNNLLACPTRKTRIRPRTRGSAAAGTRRHTHVEGTALNDRLLLHVALLHHPGATTRARLSERVTPDCGNLSRRNEFANLLVSVELKRAKLRAPMRDLA